ncbi:hypothetical protein SYNPS1DRAFT_28748 [Syncephalis pseudoplumigaleata]|uniref:DUF3533 domain-containing protein n=1 Tax=Syncephalis pseudoplumigaleata TaxID=1712513 RepID=A0A4P9YZX5_9FUNG|nr:hypothetical protein SYNPS1DRAFT_28748 [Syncephalis pseudoplumigaleata]|eukprot:RKP25525.1 hypothetical protein SYNPS1DRAFT_28748 [Syncephalis pseudoplumigaleata]
MATADPASSPRPLPRSIFPSLLNRRAVVALVVVSLVPFIYMWLYIGAFWNPSRYFSNVQVALINADAGFDFAGMPAPLQAAIRQTTGGQSMGTTIAGQLTGQNQAAFDWQVVDDPAYTYDMLHEKIAHGTYQFGLYLPRNLSASYVTAFSASNQTAYHPMVIHYAYDQGRDYTTASFVTAPITRLVSAISQGMARKMLSGPNAVQTRDAMLPAFWIEPLGLAVDVMFPVKLYGQNTASYLSVMVMYVASIAIVTITRRFIVGDPVVFGYVAEQGGEVPLKQVETRDIGTGPTESDTDTDDDDDDDDEDSGADVQPSTLSPPLTDGNGDGKARPVFSIFRIVMAKYLIMLAAIFLCALLTWLVPLALGSNQYVGASPAASLFYLVFVGFCFLNMLNLLCNLFGLDGFSLPAALFMIFMMTTGGAMLGDTLSPGFFRIGRGLPFHYAVQGLRFIYFGSLRQQMGLCCGVIIAWTAAALIPGVWAAVRAERIRRGQHIVRATKRHRLQMRRLRRKKTKKAIEQVEEAQQTEQHV